MKIRLCHGDAGSPISSLLLVPGRFPKKVSATRGHQKPVFAGGDYLGGISPMGQAKHSGSERTVTLTLLGSRAAGQSREAGITKGEAKCAL